jgi:DNA-binding LacI/PurR family transcriptional regulator
MVGRLPFKIDRKLPGDLVSQLTDGLRGAIDSGFFKPGDTLPTLKDLAIACNTSLRVPREAIERLKQEGLVNVRRSLGCMVIGRRERQWLGHVLFVIADADGSYYTSVLAGEMQRRMLNAGYLFTRMSVSRLCRSTDAAALATILQHNISLAVVFQDKTGAIVRKLAHMQVPFIEITSNKTPSASSSGIIHFAREAAVPEFVRLCQKHDVRRILQVGMDESGALDLAQDFAAVGIDVEKADLPAKSGIGRLELIQRASLQYFLSRLKSGRGIDADLVFFTDDFLTMGALQVFLSAGLRIPEDLRIVTFSNAGFGPVFSKPFTRIEMNAKTHGALAADYLLEHLRKGTLPSGAALPSVYREGDTF